MKTKFRAVWIVLLVALAIFMQGCTGTTDPIDTTEPVVTTPVVQELAIVSDNASEYSIVIPESTRSAVSEASRVVLNAIHDKTGVKLNWTDDFIERDASVPEKEILVGLTNRRESIDLLNELQYGEYAIRVMGEKIVIAAWDDASLASACDAFAALVKESGESGRFALAEDYSARDIGIAALRNLPHYGEEDEKLQFVDLADDCYMLYADDTDAAEFTAYFTTLENAGYTQFASRQFGDNLYAIYVCEETVVHASYIAADKEARIAVEDAYDMSIFVESEYEKVCEPSVTMVGLEWYGKSEEGIYNQIGLCLIIQLEDGRFIIVDGGGNSNKTAELIYNALRDLAVDKNDITIAAWILTHAHGDHVGGLLEFTEAGRHKEIEVENFIYHFSTSEQYAGIDDGPDEGRAQQTRNTIKTQYPRANAIKAHTGQVIKAGGVEIEMLYTYADLEPSHLEYHNTTSLVCRVSAYDNTVMVLGDASNRVSKHLVRVMGDYLKSDIVQISHHGYTGGTVELYEAIDADVALFPTGVASVDGSCDRRLERKYNAKAVELADEVYIAGREVYTFILPYTPEITGTPKIIM